MPASRAEGVPASLDGLAGGATHQLSTPLLVAAATPTPTPSVVLNRCSVQRHYKGGTALRMTNGGPPRHQLHGYFSAEARDGWYLMTASFVPTSRFAEANDTNVAALLKRSV